MYKNNNFDVVVVGSSLISIMKAIEESAKGRKVCVIEKRNDLGGAWSVQEVEGVGLIETAGHLLEYYKGSYEKMSKLLNIKFVKMEPQPVKVYPDGRVELYQTRYSLISRSARDMSRYSVIIIVRGINTFLLDRIKIKKWGNFYLSTLKKEMMFFFKYRFCGFLDFNGIHMPVGGFSIMSKKIQEAIHNNGIYCFTGVNVSEIKMQGDRAIITAGGEKIITKKVFISQSSNVSLIGSGITLNRVNKFKVYPHVLVHVSRLKKQNFPHYIQVRQDVDFRRIGFSRDYSANSKGALFLIQTRFNMENDTLIKEKILHLLTKCDLIENKTQIEIKHYFNDSYIGSSEDSAFIPGKINNVITCLESVGDITKNIASNS